MTIKRVLRNVASAFMIEPRNLCMRNSLGRTLTLQAAYKANVVEEEEESKEKKKPSVDYDRFPKKWLSILLVVATGCGR